ILRRQQARSCRKRRGAHAGRRSPARKRGAMKVAVAGAGGRMGRTLIELVLGAPDLELSGALEAARHPAVGTEAGAGVRVTADAAAALAAAECVIDFSAPAATLA